MTTYYVIPDDKAQFKCWECGQYGWANKQTFVKITGLFGARHKDCVDDLSTMTQVDAPKEFDPRP